MQYNPPSYYAPYQSEGEDSGEDSGDETSSYGSSGSELSEQSREVDPRYAIIRASGGVFDTSTKQLMYHKGEGGGDEYVNLSPTANTNSLLYTSTTKNVQSTLFAIRSADRDKTVYPTSSYFQLKLPRPYKDVTQVQLVQLSYPYFVNVIQDPSGIIDSVIQYISTNYVDISLNDCSGCFNSSTMSAGFGFEEIGRVNPSNGEQLTHLMKIRSGGYNAPTLANELNQQMNKTPPFNMISYADHRTTFMSTKGLDHLFNEPGHFFHNRSSDTFLEAPTKAAIMKQYFPDSNLLTGSTPTEQEAFVAYYYPVLKEAFVSPIDSLYLDFVGFPREILNQRIVEHYEGLNSPLYYNLCLENRVYLDKVRRTHTFEYNPVNQYEWSFNRQTNRMEVRFDKLHPSLTKEIHAKNDFFYSSALHRYGLNPYTFSTLQGDMKRNAAIVTDLHGVMNNALVGVGVPYSVYNQTHLGNSGNLIYTQNPSLLHPSQASGTSEHLLNLAIGAVSATPPSGLPYVRAVPYNFGEITMTDLSGESADYLINPGNYNSGYMTALSTMNGRSVLNRYVGENMIDGYSGVNVVTGNFKDLYSTFTYYHNLHSTQVSAVSSVLGHSISTMQNYMTTKYSSVFPSAILSNNGFLNGSGIGTSFLFGERIARGSTPFDGIPGNITNCCALISTLLLNYYSCLPAEYVITTLAYKMGFPATNISSIFNMSGTSNAFPQNNLYLQLNFEQSFNNMGVSGNETPQPPPIDAAPINTMYRYNETTAQSKLVMGKILTAGQGFLDTSQTIIQSPARFDTPLGRLDKLECQILLDTLVPVDKVFPFGFDYTDWDAVFQIDEEISVLDRKTDLTSVPTIQWDNNKRPF
jgi:hypothetical protein